MSGTLGSNFPNPVPGSVPASRANEGAPAGTKYVFLPAPDPQPVNPTVRERLRRLFVGSKAFYRSGSRPEEVEKAAQKRFADYAQRLRAGGNDPEPRLLERGFKQIRSRAVREVWPARKQISKEEIERYAPYALLAEAAKAPLLKMGQIQYSSKVDLKNVGLETENFYYPTSFSNSNSDAPEVVSLKSMWGQVNARLPQHDPDVRETGVTVLGDTGIFGFGNLVSGNIAVDPSSRKLVISFGGASSLAQFWDSFKAVLGFSVPESYSAARKFVQLVKEAAEASDPPLSVACVGVSRGASLATFAALSSNVKGITFNPQGLGAAAQKELRRLNPETFRDADKWLTQVTVETDWLSDGSFFATAQEVLNPLTPRTILGNRIFAPKADQRINISHARFTSRIRERHDPEWNPRDSFIRDRASANSRRPYLDGFLAADNEAQVYIRLDERIRELTAAIREGRADDEQRNEYDLKSAQRLALSERLKAANATAEQLQYLTTKLNSQSPTEFLWMQRHLPASRRGTSALAIEYPTLREFGKEARRYPEILDIDPAYLEPHTEAGNPHSHPFEALLRLHLSWKDSL